MNANIDPIPPSGSDAATPVPRMPSAVTGEDPFGLTLARAQAGRQAAALVEPTPPPELAAHIFAAARAWDSLAAAGRHVSFEQAPNGRVSIQLQDEDGNNLESVPVGRLFDLIEQHGGL